MFIDFRFFFLTGKYRQKSDVVNVVEQEGKFVYLLILRMFCK